MKVRRVSIVGLGRLGLCQSLVLEEAGWDVLGCDLFPAYVASINERTLVSSEPGVVEALQRARRLRATTSLEEAVRHSGVVLVLVATPTGIGDHVYDCGALSRVLEDIAAVLRADGESGSPSGRGAKHVVVCSTVLPGYCSTVGSLLEDCGATLSYNPEFIAQGAILEGLRRRDLCMHTHTPVATSSWHDLCPTMRYVRHPSCITQLARPLPSTALCSPHVAYTRRFIPTGFAGPTWCDLVLTAFSPDECRPDRTASATPMHQQTTPWGPHQALVI